MGSIGNNTFWNCNKLQNIKIPNSVTSIGNHAFYGCKELQNITIPNSVTSIGGYVFVGCSGLTEIKVNGGNKNYSSENGVLFNKGKTTTLICCPAGKTGTYTIPDNVKSIGVLAFACCSNLIEIKVNGKNANYSSENGVLFNKGKTTLMCCPGGKTGTYTVPNSVTSIGNYVFNDCDKLTSVTFGDNSMLDSIGEYAFVDCKTLRSIILPKNVSSIGEYAFDGCGALQSVYYTGTIDDWNTINIYGGNENLTNATIHYSKILTLKKKWKDGGDGSKRGIPKFVLEKTLNNQRTELKEGSEADGGDYMELSCKYNDGASDMFGIDSNGEMYITAEAKRVDTWVYKFIVYDYDDKAKYAVEEEPMEGYKSEAFKEKQGR